MKMYFLHYFKDKRTTNSKFFGAYYDEGRLTRYTSALPIWAAINTRAIQEYRDLEKQTGKCQCGSSFFVSIVLELFGDHEHLKEGKNMTT